MGQLRTVLVLGVVGALAAVGLLQAGVGREPAPTAAPASAQARSPALDVLHGWDDARSHAWATGDAAALRRLYVAGSAAGRADVRLLRRYLARGLVVRQLRMQVFAVRVLRRDDGFLSLRVTDRVAGGVAVTGRQRLRLPVDRPTARTVVLRRVAGEWRVASVR
jgi:hypothetical protein